MKYLIVLFCLTSVIGCYQIGAEDDLRTVPVTNNPTLVPDSGKTIPMQNMGGR